jgi:hypothetical protein
MNSFLINRESRQDRLADMRIEFDRQGINPIIFKAIEGGWKGCRDSHIELLTKCKPWHTITIYEDDVLFLYDREATVRILADAKDDLPEDWDCLYLGASPREPQTRYSENLYLLNNALTTHAIIWQNRPNGALEYILNHKDEIKKWDVFLAEVIQPRFNVFAVYPMLVTQKEGQSDTCRRSDVSQILKNYTKFCG